MAAAQGIECQQPQRGNRVLVKSTAAVMSASTAPRRSRGSHRNLDLFLDRFALGTDSSRARQRVRVGA